MTATLSAATTLKNRQDIVNVFHGDPDKTISASKRSAEHVVQGDCSVLLQLNSRTATQDARNRIVRSHVYEQATGVNRWWQTDAFKYINAVNVFDDAAMWVAMPIQNNPSEELALSTPSPAVARALRKRKRGRRQQHVPVLNLVETLFQFEEKQLDSGDPVNPNIIDLVSAARINSPATVLPQANFSTVESRWKRWALLNGTSMSGDRVDPAHVVAVPPTAWVNISLVRDCLRVNDNLINGIETATKRRRLAAPAGQKDVVETVYNHQCAGHMFVLNTKPTLSWIPGLANFVMRVGHLCQSSRMRSRLHASLLEVLRRFPFSEGARKPTGVRLLATREPPVSRYESGVAGLIGRSC